MSKDTRIQFRVSDTQKIRFGNCAAKVKLNETALGAAAVDALCDYIELHGEITLPLAVIPESLLKKLRGIASPNAPAIFTSTAAPVPSRASSLNEEPPARPVVPVAAPRITKTRAVLKRMVAKEKKKP